MSRGLQKGVRPMWNNVVITVEGLLWFCGAVAIIGGAVALFMRCFAPFQKVKTEIASKASACDLEALKKDVESLKSYQNTDHAELKKLETGIEKICKCTLAITDHELTGNSVDKLRDARDDMQDYLIQK